jgi:hypothetical protein
MKIPLGYPMGLEVNRGRAPAGPWSSKWWLVGFMFVLSVLLVACGGNRNDGSTVPWPQ